jgi:hypothetical protein
MQEGIFIISGTSAAAVRQYLIVLTYLGSHCLYKISRSWVDMLIFMSFYLESCIWPDAILRWIWQRVCIKFCANLGKSAVIRQVFEEENMSCTWVFEWHAWFRVDHKR